MQRTQIYFPESLYEDIRTGASSMGVTVSEYIRRVLKETLYDMSTKVSIPNKKTTRPTLLAKSAVSLGKTDLSRNFGRYLEASLK